MNVAGEGRKRRERTEYDGGVEERKRLRKGKRKRKERKKERKTDRKKERKKER